jgi:LPXTG-motif cell wall-anchored protein
MAAAQQTLANTGADAALLPLALVLLAIGALLVIRRKKA